MTRDQFLTQKVLGECWHDFWNEPGTFKSIGERQFCDKCGAIRYPSNPYTRISFSTPDGFFKLWNFCKEQEWWGKFIQKQLAITRDSTFECAFSLIFLSQLINPDTFADAIARYRGWEGE